MMPHTFSTGSLELDSLLEELRAGDNVVFYTDEVADYVPFVAALRSYLSASPAMLVYVRTSGILDDVVASLPELEVIDVVALAVGDDVLFALEREARRLGPYVYYVFDPLISWLPWLDGEEDLGRFFTTICPLLYELQSIAYWDLNAGRHRLDTVARIKDCTQVFVRLERADADDAGPRLLLTPLKVWGRYSEAMFRPHHVLVDDGEIHMVPLSVGQERQGAYVRALASKNKELADIRDALDRSNRTLRTRNRELAELNRQLAEQSRLYQSLRVNLDHLLALFQAGQEIGSSLVVDQVRQAIVTATQRLFDLPGGRLHLMERDGSAPIELQAGEMPPYGVLPHAAALAAAREEVCQELEVKSYRGDDDDRVGSLALAPILIRGTCRGTLEAYAPDERLHTGEARTLLRYLASEAGIALDNAHLYRETEIQGEQLRSFIEDVITSEERESRQLAFDLHDGLVQMIVASFQHLQTAQAWRGRDPKTEEREIQRGVRLLREAIYESRRLIAQLRPAGLDDFGLGHALRLYVSQLDEDADWQVGLDIAPDWPDLPPPLEASLFRIVQEATNNARKYAEADRVHIELELSPAGAEQELCLTVRDWGKGFDPGDVSTAASCGTGIGLIGIRERARHWGGTCRIESGPGQGTAVRVCIPCSRALTEAAERD